MRRAQEAEDTTKQRDSQKQHYDQLRKQRLDEFMAGFTAISFKLKEMYQVRAFQGSRFPVCNLTSSKIDDHPRRKCGTRAGGQHGSLLGRYHLQRDATEEELEEYLQSVWWREDPEFSCAGVRSSRLQGKAKPQLCLYALRLNWLFTSSPPRCTSWTRSMPRWISGTCLSSRTTSRTELRMRSSSSFPSGTNRSLFPFC